MKLDEFRNRVFKYNKKLGRKYNEDLIDLQRAIHALELREFEDANEEKDSMDAACDSFVTLCGFEFYVDEWGDDRERCQLNMYKTHFENTILKWVKRSGLVGVFKNYLDAVIKSNDSKFSLDPKILKESQKEYQFKTKIVSIVYDNDVLHHLISDTDDKSNFPRGKQLKPLCYKKPGEFFDHYE